MPRPRAPCVVCEEIAKKFTVDHPDEPALPVNEHDIALRAIPKTPKMDEEGEYGESIPPQTTKLLCWSHAPYDFLKFMGVE